MLAIQQLYMQWCGNVMSGMLLNPDASGYVTLTEYGNLVGSKFVTKQVKDGAWVELTEK